jgi:hypothetical protein
LKETGFHMNVDRSRLVEELVEYFASQEFTVHGARGLRGYTPPPPISNDGFGDLKPRVPDVAGLDRKKQRIVFGIIRETKQELDAEQSLADYNVFLDHRQSAGDQASGLVVLLPSSLLADFTEILTHYIHREYWHRVTVVASHLMV